jgi:hypothetical protein
MTALQRRFALYGALVLSTACAAWLSHASDNTAFVVAAPDMVRVRVPATAPGGVPPAASAVVMKTIDRPGAFVGERNPFAVRSWANVQAALPAPSASAAEPPASAPTAPPLPFVFAGKLEDPPGTWVIYLVKGKESFALSKGDTFDTHYRFEGIEDGKLVIQYLPLATKQFLPIGTDEQFQ